MTSSIYSNEIDAIRLKIVDLERQHAAQRRRYFIFGLQAGVVAMALMLAAVLWSLG